MKRKTSIEKSGRIVAWINKAEWDQVTEYLYSTDSALQKYALHRISAWRGRFGNSTPVAVESTAELVRCQVLDASGQLDSHELVLLYGMALVRFVNLITERRQKIVTIPLRRLASQMNIPEWIVNLRHEITHQKLPTLNWCRKGCKFVLEWLQREYWSRQLNGSLAEPWDSESEEEEEEEEELAEDDYLSARLRRREIFRKARELLISYEKEQFQTVAELHRENKARKVWPSPSSDLEWIVMQIKEVSAESSEVLMDVLLSDGFLVPTVEQLESLDIDLSENANPSSPCIPRLFLRFWAPLLKSLGPAFAQVLLEKLFLELQLCGDTSDQRARYVSGWISEILCGSDRAGKPAEGVRRCQARNKAHRFVSRASLQWQKLLTLCLESPCPATPRLLQQILTGMDRPLPLDTQRKLLQLCSIYTQAGGSCPSPGPEDQPVYTLESLQTHARQQAQRLATRDCGPAEKTAPKAMDALQQYPSPEAVAERAALLKGSPWQICTDDVRWQDYPLGKVPHQSEDPGCLMLDHFSTMSVLDQVVDSDRAAHNANPSVSGSSRTASDGPLWTHSDLCKLKTGLQMF